MSTTEKSRFLGHRGEVSEAQERWILIECEAFGCAYKYLVWIEDCKRTVVVVERVRARGDNVEVQGPH